MYETVSGIWKVAGWLVYIVYSGCSSDISYLLFRVYEEHNQVLCAPTNVVGCKIRDESEKKIRTQSRVAISLTTYNFFSSANFRANGKKSKSDVLDSDRLLSATHKKHKLFNLNWSEWEYFVTNKIVAA